MSEEQQDLSSIALDLTKYLQSEHWRVREAIAVALGTIRDSVAVPALLEVLLDKNEPGFIRSKAAASLGYICDPQAVEGLLQALHENHYDLRMSAGGALVSIARHTDRCVISRLIDLLSDPQDGIPGLATQWLVELHDLAVPALLDTLQNGEKAWARTYAAAALGRIGDKSTVPNLLQSLQDPAANVRFSSAEALGYIGEAVAIPQLMAALDDTDPGVRCQAIIALDRLESTELISEQLQAMLLDEDEHHSVHAVAHIALNKLTQSE